MNSDYDFLNLENDATIIVGLYDSKDPFSESTSALPTNTPPRQ